MYILIWKQIIDWRYTNMNEQLEKHLKFLKVMKSQSIQLDKAVATFKKKFYRYKDLEKRLARIDSKKYGK